MTNTQQQLTPIPDNEAVEIVTAVMRDADQLFQTTGGGTRHYVRDLLIPMLEKVGIKLCKQSPD